jgi:hypothetical protein
MLSSEPNTMTYNEAEVTNSKFRNVVETDLMVFHSALFLFFHVAALLMLKK